MERSLLYQLGHPTGETAEASARDGLELLVRHAHLAEELGLRAFWLLPSVANGGGDPPVSVQIWLAALAARTTRVRLGWGLPGLAPPSTPPMRYAEQTATLDLSSDGRLEIGLIPAGTFATGDAAGNAAREEWEIEGWDEGVRMLVDMWDRPTFSWTSERFDVPPVDVLPKPRQRPHPPLWWIGWTEEHAMQAGTIGLGFLDVSGGTDRVLARHLSTYHGARSDVAPTDRVGAARFAAVVAGAGDGGGMQRIAGWESMGIDEAVLHLGSSREDLLQYADRIRIWVQGDDRLH